MSIEDRKRRFFELKAFWHSDVHDEQKWEANKETLRALIEMRRVSKENELEVFLSWENDSCSCYIEVQAGAGGTESNDWASVLTYKTLAQRRKFSVTGRFLERLHDKANHQLGCVGGTTWSTSIGTYWNLGLLSVFMCSDKPGLSLEIGSFAAGVMISTTDLAEHTLEQISFDRVLPKRV